MQIRARRTLSKFPPTTLTFRILHLILVSLVRHDFITAVAAAADAAIVRPIQGGYLAPDAAPTHGRVLTRVYRRRQHDLDPLARDRGGLLCLLF